MNRQDLDAAAKLLDPHRYRENCVGFTHGFVGWEDANASIRQVWQGLPNLNVELHNVVATGDVALGRGTVRGTATGRLYGAPATKRSFESSVFDYVRLQNGLIVERVQQAGVRLVRCDSCTEKRSVRWGSALCCGDCDAQSSRIDYTHEFV